MYIETERLNIRDLEQKDKEQLFLLQKIQKVKKSCKNNSYATTIGNKESEAYEVTEHEYKEDYGDIYCTQHITDYSYHMYDFIT